MTLFHDENFCKKFLLSVNWLCIVFNKNTRDPNSKSKLNRLSKDFKSALYQIENIEMANYLQGLPASEATDYSL